MNLEEFGPDAKDEMSPSEYIQYCLERYREYRILAMDPTNNTQATQLYLDKASEYYARAQEAIDEIEPDMTDHLSDEDKALPNKSLADQEAELSPEDQAMIDKYEEEEANREVPRDYASMYENENQNKMNEINKNRWAKLAGINENEGNVKGNEDWEGHVNGLGGEGQEKVFDRMGDIILAKYPEEGRSTYRMEVYYNDNNEPTGANGGFAIENGNVYFDFKFKDGKVVDYSFDEQNY